MFFMKTIIFLTFFLIPYFAYSEGLKLECTLKDYNAVNRSYSPSVIKSWVPENQTHIINVDKSSFWNNLGIDGVVKINNTKKINIKYEYKYKGSSGQWAKFDFLYFKTTKKVSIGLIFPGYQPVGDIWGSCIEIKSVTKKLMEKSENKNKIINSVSTINNKTEPAEIKCKELGFKKGTENFGNCVLKLID